jgi:hypothetical protein
MMSLHQITITTTAVTRLEKEIYFKRNVIDFLLEIRWKKKKKKKE